MIWLIWLAVIVLVPIAAGVRVWYQLRHESPISPRTQESNPDALATPPSS